MTLERKKNEWLEIPARSFNNPEYAGSSIKVFRNGDLVGFLVGADREPSSLNAFNVNDLRDIISEFEMLPSKPEGPLR